VELLGDLYRIELPTLEIPPGTERFLCYYGTYEGPDSGVVGMNPQLEEDFLHHSLIKNAIFDEQEPGTLRDCTAVEDQWPPTPVLFDALNGAIDESVPSLPEGIAFRLSSGLRWMVDTHYINTTSEPLCIENNFELELVPDAEVENYASAFALDMGAFSLPANQEVTLEFDCAWPVDLTLLSIAGHMHGYGKEFEILFNSGSGFETIYRVEDWEPEYGSQSPMTLFSPDGLPVAAGSVVRTRCTWDNTTDGPLSFPNEMCTTFGAAYPLSEALYCDAGVFVGPEKHPGVVEGLVTRSEEVSGDGIGNLRVALFGQPLGPDPGPPFADLLIENVDFSDEAAAINYRLDNVALRAEPYYVLAFFDEDESGTLNGPNGGDLMAFSSPGQGPEVTVADEQPVLLNLDLNVQID